MSALIPCCISTAGHVFSGSAVVESHGGSTSWNSDLQLLVHRRRHGFVHIRNFLVRGRLIESPVDTLPTPISLSWGRTSNRPIRRGTMEYGSHCLDRRLRAGGNASLVTKSMVYRKMSCSLRAICSHTSSDTRGSGGLGEMDRGNSSNGHLCEQSENESCSSSSDEECVWNPPPLVASHRPDMVGILGGMGPHTTVHFMKRVIDTTPAKRNADHIPFIVCSDPTVPDWEEPMLGRRRVRNSRTAVVMPGKDDDSGAQDSNGAAAHIDPASLSPLPALIEKRRFLEQAGARCIVMPSHAAHFWFDQLAEGCTVPFLHIADAVAEDLRAQMLQPLEAGGKVKIGILGTEATLRAGFYQARLREEGYEVVLPDQATMEHLVGPGIEALQRRDMEGACNLLRIAVQTLLVNAVNVVLLAGHEMLTVFPKEEPLLERCLDPMDALARVTVKWAFATRAKQRNDF